MRCWLGFALGAMLVAAAPQQKKRAASPAPPPAAAPVIQAPTTFPLESLRVQGNRHFTPEKIIAATGLKTGQPVTKVDFDAARARLLATGAFESVGYEFKPSAANSGYDATFEVVEVAQFYPYRFEELPATEDALRAALAKLDPLLGAEIPVTREVLGRYERALTDFLQGKVAVQGRLISDLAAGPTIVFRPPGDRARVAEVHFTGNQAIPTSQLANRLADVAIGAAYTDPALRLLLDTSIRPLYEARGLIRVSFPKVVAEKSKENEVDGVSVTVTVDEGAPYKLGDVRLAGVAASQMSELKDLAKWKTDEVANFDEIKAGVGRIERRYRGTGYLHVSSKVDRTVHDQEHTVDLVVTIQPGAQFSFGKLDVKGLDLIGEPAIRKMWGEKGGKPFDPEFPDAFLKDVRDQGLFDNLGTTSSETKVNEASKTADVTLTFNGAPAQNPRRKRLGEQP
jgi:outer membrane protein insertion porin family